MNALAPGVVLAGSTEKRILAVAGDHLRQFGPKRLTVVAVAEAAGMTHANVYRYFPSKDALIDAVLGAWFRALETRLAAIADAPDPADDKLERMAMALARTQREALESDGRMFEVALKAIEANQGVARKHRLRLRGLFERVLDEGIAANSFFPTDRDHALALIFDLTYRFTHPLCVRINHEMPAEAAAGRLATALEVLLRALKSGAV